MSNFNPLISAEYYANKWQEDYAILRHFISFVLFIDENESIETSVTRPPFLKSEDSFIIRDEWIPCRVIAKDILFMFDQMLPSEINLEITKILLLDQGEDATWRLHAKIEHLSNLYIKAKNFKNRHTNDHIQHE